MLVMGKAPRIRTGLFSARCRSGTIRSALIGNGAGVHRLALGLSGKHSGRNKVFAQCPGIAVIK